MKNDVLVFSGKCDFFPHLVHLGAARMGTNVQNRLESCYYGMKVIPGLSKSHIARLINSPTLLRDMEYFTTDCGLPSTRMSDDQNPKFRALL